jgi:hypothetical protein
MDNYETKHAAEIRDEILERHFGPEPSALPPPEPQGHCERSRLATGSLPVSSAEALLESYEAHAAGNDRDAAVQRRLGSQSLAELYENNAVIWRKAAEMLRRHMASPTERQPEENNELRNAP